MTPTSTLDQRVHRLQLVLFHSLDRSRSATILVHPLHRNLLKLRPTMQVLLGDLLLLVPQLLRLEHYRQPC